MKTTMMRMKENVTILASVNMMMKTKNRTIKMKCHSSCILGKGIVHSKVSELNMYMRTKDNEKSIIHCNFYVYLLVGDGTINVDNFFKLELRSM